MSGSSDLVEILLPIVGDKILKKVKEQVTKASEDSKDPIKRTILSLMAEATEEMGEKGLEIAEREIKNLLDGKRADISWASPRTASDAVAILQNAEREHKKKAKAAIQEAGELFGTIGALFFKAMLVGAL